MNAPTVRRLRGLALMFVIGLAGSIVGLAGSALPAAAAVGSSQAVDVRETLSRFDEADTLIAKGLAAIGAARAAAEKQVSKLAKPVKGQH